jgi:hypothetical protein
MNFADSKYGVLEYPRVGVKDLWRSAHELLKDGTALRSQWHAPGNAFMDVVL